MQIYTPKESEPEFGCFSALFNIFKKQQTPPPKIPSMFDTAIWPSIVLKYDQHVRKILAIHELQDIPKEVWSELPWLKRYEADKCKAVRVAIAYYTCEYEELHGTMDGRDQIQSIINDEFNVWEW